MHLKIELLQELSELFVGDLRASQYYQKLSPEERNLLESRIARDAARGSRPLLPGALPQDIELTKQRATEQLGLELPPELLDVFVKIDGFSENGVTLYGTEQDLPDEQAYGASIIAENLSLWSVLPDTVEEYLFIGDSDLWYFVLDLRSGRYAALSRSSLELAHYFDSVEEMVNDMLAQALRIPQGPKQGTDSPQTISGTTFSAN